MCCEAASLPVDASVMSCKSNVDRGVWVWSNPFYIDSPEQNSLAFQTFWILNSIQELMKFMK